MIYRILGLLLNFFWISIGGFGLLAALLLAEVAMGQLQATHHEGLEFLRGNQYLLGTFEWSIATSLYAPIYLAVTHSLGRLNNKRLK